ncbi:unnamed protein product, partial [Pylaiella littoralis]
MSRKESGGWGSLYHSNGRSLLATMTLIGHITQGIRLERARSVAARNKSTHSWPHRRSARGGLQEACKHPQDPQGQGAQAGQGLIL